MTKKRWDIDTNWRGGELFRSIEAGILGRLLSKPEHPKLHIRPVHVVILHARSRQETREPAGEPDTPRLT